MSAVHPTARKRMRSRGAGTRPPGVPMKMFHRLNVTFTVAVTSGPGATPLPWRARSVTVIARGMASIAWSGNHLSVTEAAYGAATLYVPSAAAAWLDVDKSGRPAETRSNFTGPSGVRPAAFGLTASSSDRHGRTGASVMAPAAGGAPPPRTAAAATGAAPARRSGVDRIMPPPEESGYGGTRASMTRTE